MANPCTEEYEPHMRRGDPGEPAEYGKARRPAKGRQVNAAAVGGKRSFLSGEVSLDVHEMLDHCVHRVGGTGRAVRLIRTREKSAEAIVPAGMSRSREGPNARAEGPLAFLRERR